MLKIERAELRFGKLLLLQISHESIDASGNVPNMKSNRSEPMRRSPNLLHSKPLGVPSQILARLFKRAQDRSNQRIYSAERSTQPRFRRIRLHVQNDSEKSRSRCGKLLVMGLRAFFPNNRAG